MSEVSQSLYHVKERRQWALGSRNAYIRKLQQEKDSDKREVLIRDRLR